MSQAATGNQCGKREVSEQHGLWEELPPLTGRARFLLDTSGVRIPGPACLLREQM